MTSSVRSEPAAPSDLRAALRSGSEGSFGWMGTWRSAATWSSPDGRHAVAHRVIGRVALVIGAPAGPAEGRVDAARTFASRCARLGLVPAFWAADRGLADDLGWATVPIGVDAVVDPAAFSLRGRGRRDVRCSINRARRSGIRTIRTSWAALDADRRAQVASLCAGPVPARRLPQLGFTVGGVTELDDPEVLLVLAQDGRGRVLAVTSWLPVHRDGVLVGRTLDLMRRAAAAPNGLVEVLIADVLAEARTDGLEAVGLSAVPLAGQLPPLLAAARRALEPLYGFRSLAAFKDKFGPEHRSVVLALPARRHLPTVALAVLRAYLEAPVPPAAASGRVPGAGATLPAC